jgi:hypothetical protein
VVLDVDGAVIEAATVDAHHRAHAVKAAGQQPTEAAANARDQYRS